ncbi:MAG TPA: hypothetical protein VHV77_03210, partial [Pirellulales bacterium]|nr:hypothetical protein [Pirellulales bacterium]
GKSGVYYYWIARGVDHRPVRPNRIRKSIGAENTFFQDLRTFDTLREALMPILEKVWHHYEKNQSRGRTVTLKVKYADFQIISRSRSVPTVVASKEELEMISLDLLRSLTPASKGIRLLGISFSNFVSETYAREPQMALVF